MAQRTLQPLVRNSLTILTTVVLGVGALFAVPPRAALANCDVTKPSEFLFTCAVNTITVNTSNILAPGIPTNSRTQIAPVGSAVDVTINQGVSISGSGLDFNPITAQNETITNNGSVTKTTASGGPALHFFNGGTGAVTYTGNGSVSASSGIGLGIGGPSIQFGTAAVPIVPNYSGPVEGADIAGSQSVAVYLSGGTITGGIGVLSFGNTPAPINLTGHTTITAGTSGFGVAVSGAADLYSDANIGDASHRALVGIQGDGINKSLKVTNGTGGNIFATNIGLQAITQSANIDVTNNGAISVAGGFGIVAVAQSGSANVTVRQNGTITTSPGASSEVGISAGTIGTLHGDVAISVAGNIATSTAASGNGVNALATNGNLVIDVAPGAMINAGGVGIEAASSGGTTTINVLGTVTGGLFAAQYTGTMNVGNGGTTGTIVGNILDRGVLNFNRADAVKYAGVISDTLPGGAIGTGVVQQNGAGTLTLTGDNIYHGATNVNGGMLIVDGSIAASSMTTVNAGATFGGTGTVGDTQVNAGGTFAPGALASPGTSMTVAGNLAFQSGALYLVFLDPATSSFANVTGTATLNGLVGANFATGTYAARRYTILTATGGVSGTFAGLDSLGLASDFRTSLSYDATHAYLNLALNFAPPSGTLNGNQQNVANAIIAFFNANGGIAIVFGGLTPAGLTQLSGEGATGAQQATFDAMSQFINLLTDPFISGRGDPVSAGGGTTPYADEALANATKRKTDAFAMFTKASPVIPFAQRWSVWAAGFGGSQRTDGNALLGSNDTRSSIFGTAVGIDYRLSPNTLTGFAIAGGGTNFSVNTLGSGRSDLFQAGAFVRHNVGPAYLTGALAYGWQDITTDRFVTIAGLDHLRAQFNANAWSGRVEGGYRFVVPVAGGVGVTPYAAGQFSSFDLPAYMEQAISGANTFALGYNAKTATDARSELGIRTDKSFAMPNGIFTVRGRLAWAHDYDPDRNILATFQTLPGASFVVNGARHAADSALTTTSAEWKWINGWSAAATFEGEFLNASRSYAGKGVVRYAW